MGNNGLQNVDHALARREAKHCLIFYIVPSKNASLAASAIDAHDDSVIKKIESQDELSMRKKYPAYNEVKANIIQEISRAAEIDNNPAELLEKP